MMWNLDKCRRQMLPVAAQHCALCRSFDITGEQNTALAVINAHHAGAIIAGRSRSRQRPKRAKG